MDKEQILARALSVEDGLEVEWHRRRETDRDIMKPKARRGQYLHITGRPGKFGAQVGLSQGEWHGKPRPPKPAIKPKMSRRQRAKADREAKTNA